MGVSTYQLAAIDADLRPSAINASTSFAAFRWGVSLVCPNVNMVHQERRNRPCFDDPASNDVPCGQDQAFYRWQVPEKCGCRGA